MNKHEKIINAAGLPEFLEALHDSLVELADDADADCDFDDVRRELLLLVHAVDQYIPMKATKPPYHFPSKRNQLGFVDAELSFAIRSLNYLKGRFERRLHVPQYIREGVDSALWNVRAAANNLQGLLDKDDGD